MVTMTDEDSSDNLIELEGSPNALEDSSNAFKVDPFEAVEQTLIPPQDLNEPVISNSTPIGSPSAPVKTPTAPNMTGIFVFITYAILAEFMCFT
jgi:hypothetical protein